jgi:hypothetical protein
VSPPRVASASTARPASWARVAEAGGGQVVQVDRDLIPAPRPVRDAAQPSREVGDGDDQPTAGDQEGGRGGEERARIRQMLDDVLGEDRVEPHVGMGGAMIVEGAGG